MTSARSKKILINTGVEKKLVANSHLAFFSGFYFDPYRVSKSVLLNTKMSLYNYNNQNLPKTLTTCAAIETTEGPQTYCSIVGFFTFFIE